MASLAGNMLAAESFHVLLPETLEGIGRQYGFTVVCSRTVRCSKQVQFGWHEKYGSVSLEHWPWDTPRILAQTHVDLVGNGALKSLGAMGGLCVSVGLEGGDSFQLLVGYSQPQDVSAETVDALKATVNLLALGASRQIYKDEALYDSLTGVYNRRFMDLALPGELDRAKRFQAALALVMIDIDRFKEINDTHGHVEGDRVLTAVSQILSESVRSSDMAIRYGGDEFVLLLPATPLLGVQRVVSRIQERVRMIDAPQQLSLSGGVAAARKDISARQFLLEADGHLYHAKESGRDRFTFPTNPTEFPAPPSFFQG